jgi:hypothetical protein
MVQPISVLVDDEVVLMSQGSDIMKKGNPERGNL